MPPKFQHTTRAAFKDQFFSSVGDKTRTFWTDEEANILLNEALYTLGGIGHLWRGQIEIKTVLGQSFYDLSTDLFNNQELMAYNLTYQFILDAINFHLIENISLANP